MWQAAKNGQCLPKVIKCHTLVSGLPGNHFFQVSSHRPGQAEEFQIPNITNITNVEILVTCITYMVRTAEADLHHFCNRFSAIQKNSTT